MKRHSLKKILCVCQYDIKFFFRYPMKCMWLGITPLIYIGVGALMLTVMGIDRFTDFTGGATDSGIYAAIGYAVFSLSNYAWQISGKVEREMLMGTAKMNLLLPMRPSDYIYGLSLSNSFSTGLIAIIILAICTIIAAPAPDMLLKALGFLALAMLYYFGISLIMASAALRYKSISGMANILTFALQVLTGLILPIRLMPGALRTLSYALPTTWAIDSIRSSILGVEPLAGHNVEFFIMLGAALFTNIVGNRLLNAACKYVRSNGLMDAF